jgi:hypothetical protein
MADAANDIVYILPNPGGSAGPAHQIDVNGYIEFRLEAGVSCEVQLSSGPSKTTPPNLPHTDDWVYTLPASSHPGDLIYQFYFDSEGTITYWINPSLKAVPGGGHTVIVGSVGFRIHEKR